MTVDRRPTDRYSSNRDQAHRTALHLAEFVTTNIAHLRKVDTSGKMERAAKSFRTLLANGEELTPGQHSFLEGIYESTMRGAGFESAPVHTDKKRRGMRFGSSKTDLALIKIYLTQKMEEYSK